MLEGSFEAEIIGFSGTCSDPNGIDQHYVPDSKDKRMKKLEKFCKKPVCKEHYENLANIAAYLVKKESAWLDVHWEYLYTFSWGVDMKEDVANMLTEKMMGASYNPKILAKLYKIIRRKNRFNSTYSYLVPVDKARCDRADRSILGEFGKDIAAQVGKMIKEGDLDVKTFLSKLPFSYSARRETRVYDCVTGDILLEQALEGNAEVQKFLESATEAFHLAQTHKSIDAMKTYAKFVANNNNAGAAEMTDEECVAIGKSEYDKYEPPFCRNGKGEKFYKSEYFYALVTAVRLIHFAQFKGDYKEYTPLTDKMIKDAAAADESIIKLGKAHAPLEEDGVSYLRKYYYQKSKAASEGFGEQIGQCVLPVICATNPYLYDYMLTTFWKKKLTGMEFNMENLGSIVMTILSEHLEYGKEWRKL